jgi:hypothetical protein
MVAVGRRWELPLRPLPPTGGPHPTTPATEGRPAAIITPEFNPGAHSGRVHSDPCDLDAFITPEFNPGDHSGRVRGICIHCYAEVHEIPYMSWCINTLIVFVIEFMSIVCLP